MGSGDSIIVLLTVPRYLPCYFCVYYVYVLQSDSDANLYIGSTSNLKKRLADHQVGRVEATKYRRPLRLVYYEASLSKDKTYNREKYFKTGFGRRFLKNRI
ncbi:MAG: GIY-YIG nuclease family protein [Patescibacteria group bacterium]|nr:MAG: GIY-YIG nuclease family protein [Patescibacteria group bacterium]